MTAVVARTLDERSFGVPKVLFLVASLDSTRVVDEVRCVDDRTIRV